MSHGVVLIGLIARREAEFYGEVMKFIRRAFSLKREVIFLVFHEGCVSILNRYGEKSLNFHELKRCLSKVNYLSSLDSIEDEYKVKFDDLVRHEKLTHGIKDDDFLRKKVCLYFSIMKYIVEVVRPSVFLMELGGFIANLVPYYVCKKYGITHYTIEPACFPGRCFWVKDSLYVKIPRSSTSHDRDDIRKAVENFLNDFIRSKKVNIPDKDKHHFKDMTLKKLMAKRNISRLTGKLVDKYIFRNEEEYNAILHVVRYNLWKWRNRNKNVRYYRDLRSIEGRDFIYYPLHVPLDIQLTVRSSQYLDQIRLLERVASVLPESIILVTKEHPASIGSYEFEPLRHFISKNRIVVLHPLTNSHDIIDKSKCVLTVNSKVGIEAILRGKTTVVVGDAFYRGHDITIDLDNIEYFPKILNEIDKFRIDRNKLEEFLYDVYLWSKPGELYLHSKDNISIFSESMINLINY